MSTSEPPPTGERSGAALADVTALLRAVESGEPQAADRLYSIVYGELRRIASGYLRRRPPSQTLETTELVHEAYLKLARGAAWSVRDRYHFFALVAQVMRRILVDQARGRGREKRGGGALHVTLEGLDPAIPEPATDLLALEHALEKLEQVDPDLARLVEWRFFAGREIAEIAELRGVSDRTIKRHWQSARAFLFRELAGGSAPR